MDSSLVAFHLPLAPVAESYRHLQISLEYGGPSGGLRSFVVTSANPKEGKTTTAANLAITFAQTRKRVLLVDADMRRPQLHRLFRVENKAGLTEALSGAATLDGVILKTEITGLDLLTRGTFSPNPSEGLGSDRMKKLLALMTERYDVVLFDSAPLLAVTDAALLGGKTDGVMLVASAGETAGDALKRIAEFLRNIKVPLLGIVLTKFDIRKVYGGYASSYHYGYYGYEYRHENGNGAEAMVEGVASRFRSRRKEKRPS